MSTPTPTSQTAPQPRKPGGRKTVTVERQYAPDEARCVLALRVVVRALNAREAPAGETE